MDFTVGIPQRLGHLPLVMDVFRRTGMARIIDHAIGQDARSKVSASECVAVILCGVYSGSHSLWRLRERLEHYDMKTIMQDASFSLNDFPEERLGKALDDLFRFDLDKLMSGIAIEMVRAFDLDMSFLHFDTTTLSFFGAYEGRDSWSGADGMPPVPHVTYGHSKDHRPDLKQILYGMLVSRDGGVPLLGKALDGNASDSKAAADFFARVRELVADPREVCCVVDSKGWCARVLDTAQEHGLRVLSRLPRTHGLHEELMGRSRSDGHILTLPGKRRRDEPQIYTYHGYDVTETLTYHVIDAKGTRSKRSVTVPARAVRVHSSALLRSKMSTRSRLSEREGKRVIETIRDWQDRVYACAADAQRAADRHIAQAGFATLDITAAIEHHEGPAKRGRGRPRKRPEPALAAMEHWRVRYATKPVTENITKQRLHDQATFILIRTASKKWAISDEEMIARYQGQYTVEHGFAWLKSGAPIDPIYLHTEHRIASLCFIYCLGLMVWNLIQRTVRTYLKDNQLGLPYHRNIPSDTITTRFLFELFPKVQTVPISSGRKMIYQLAGMEKWQRLACKALGTRTREFERPVG